MTVYVIGHIHIDDPETYRGYEQGFMEIFRRHGGTLLAADDATETLEGETIFTRCVVASFPDADAARAWYHSDDYQRLAAIRWSASTGSVWLARGFS